MRLFIALDFEELRKDLIGLQNNIDESLAKLKKASTFHLTLKFLGKISLDKVELIKEKLKDIKFEPLTLTLGQIGVFPKEEYIRVIWVSVKPTEQAIELQENIESALKELNIKKGLKFHPHITLARVKIVNDKEKFIKNLKELKIEKSSTKIKNFKLIESKLTQEGPIYNDVALFP